MKSYMKMLNFPQALVNICLKDDSFINKLKPKEFLYMMFIASLYQDIPGSFQSKNHIEERNELPEILIQKCLEVIPDLDHVEIGILAFALYTGNIHLLGQNSKLLAEAMLKAILTMPGELVGKPYSPLNDLCKVLAQSESGMVNKGTGENTNLLVNKYAFQLSSSHFIF